MNRPLSPAPVPALTGSDLHLPLNFVAGGKPVWPEISRGDTISIDATLLRDRCNDGFACWILQTYVLMRQAGLDPTLSTLPRPDAVNVVHPFFFGLRHRGLAYILACRADAHEPWAANFWLDQNGARGEGPRHAAVPHWPQPGLMPRDPRRGTRIETLVFKGEEINFDSRFRDPAFLAALGELGVTLRLDVFGPGRAGPLSGPVFDWHDYTSADLVLAARNMTPADAAGKPASKLVNAWLAGVPALLGPEPAFRELRRSELDYAEIRTPADVLAAVHRLKAEPDRYRAMIETGRRRAADFTVARTLDRWLAILNGPVRADFERWQARGPLGKALRVGPDILRDRLAKRAHLAEIRTGTRILDFPT
ncbi:MAG: glycosyltransferase [Amaricoccus sp.]